MEFTGSNSPGRRRRDDAPPAEPLEGFPSCGELAYDIGIVLAIMLGLAALANAALQG